LSHRQAAFFLDRLPEVISFIALRPWQSSEKESCEDVKGDEGKRRFFENRGCSASLCRSSAKNGAAC
jgi:hypothetical protein